MSKLLALMSMLDRRGKDLSHFCTLSLLFGLLEFPMEFVDML